MKTLISIISLFLACQFVVAQQIQQEQLLLDLAVLSADSLQGRYTDTEGGEKARAYIISRLQQIGVSAYVPSYEQNFEFFSNKKRKTLAGKNILGMIDGYNENIIVLSAHYDHLGMKDTLNIFNGADDNASGVAALLQLAEYFVENEPNNTLLFAFFDGEEHGKKGAFAYANSVIADTFRIKLNVNLDMIGRNDKNELYASGTFHYPFLKPYIQKSAASTPLKISFGHDNPKNRQQQDWTNSSDHAAFHALGIPYIYFGVEDHADYHKMSDEFDKIQPEFYLHAVQFVLETVKLLDENLEEIVLKTSKKK